MKTALDELADALGDRVERNAPFGVRTTYRVGGTAGLLVVVADEGELSAVAGITSRFDVPLMVLGRGSNLLVADVGFPGLVVVLGAGFESIRREGDQLTAGGALSLPVLARRSVAMELTGLEWAVGVPGSVGGALRMNAGGHGSDMAATVRTFRWIDLSTGEVGVSTLADLACGYRSTSIRPGQVVVDVSFALRPGDPEAGQAEISEIVRWRREHQPGGSNAGSVFTNPPDDSAGRLIDSCGLRGFRIGTAEVSTKHANFIQADAGGLAADVASVMEHVRNEVERKRGVRLSTEIRMAGFDDAGGGA